jgi:DNA segregation ATPase FtsK/SpoIIIE, S-DNA-T family
MDINDPFIKRLIGASSSYEALIQQEVIKLSLKMTSFSFTATFIKAEVGPVVTTYFYQPDPRSNLSTIFAREEDLALALSVESIMISRELGYITIAVPRRDREVVQFDKCLFEGFSNPDVLAMSLPILMGVDTKGNKIYMDLAEQPHLLIGGATNSGKSIFTSQAICSLALRHTPQELEFILCDTKQLDLVLFEKLEHVSAVHRDIHAIRQCIEELISHVRIRTISMSGVARNIKEYNANQINWNTSAYQYTHSPLMTYKILIIDEFADVIGSDREWLNTLPKKERPEAIETLLQRLAQISRAAGIHIILATQRPSVKILSGDAKTNFPARIAFKLPSMQDSRVVLDENGAEKLLGKGDYLYKISGSDTVKRAHSAFVTMKDITLILSQHDMLRQQFHLV